MISDKLKQNSRDDTIAKKKKEDVVDVLGKINQVSAMFNDIYMKNSGKSPKGSTQKKDGDDDQVEDDVAEVISNPKSAKKPPPNNLKNLLDTQMPSWALSEER